MMAHINCRLFPARVGMCAQTVPSVGCALGIIRSSETGHNRELAAGIAEDVRRG
ncbi:MAG: hypothetical protein AVDCRST_MAG31-2275 [uncultured Sphingomonas sp.]|uniref:Flavodoxin-like domain-containing protein n=1 Tax=uncultured Sphingomonas sp. TaxID=158754 RepID=A0A6J4TRS3_9SPHN|nr:MAG: hypothetical protein AVDCRST_MAG31-2275 [uncultured Sphingomonas sp.]